MPFVLFLWSLFFIAGCSPAPVQADKPLLREQHDSLHGRTTTANVHDVAFGKGLLPPRSAQALVRQQQGSEDWVFWLFLGCFFSLALARFLFADGLRQFISAIYIYRNFNQMDREGAMIKEFPSLLLFLNYLFVFALLLFPGMQYMGLFQADLNWHPALLTLTVMAGILAFMLLKRMMIAFLSWVFGTRLASQLYLKNAFLFNIFSGMILLPLVAAGLFMPSEKALLLAWGVWLLIHFFRVMRGAIIAHASAGFSGYYLILYLCGVELAPVLLIIKAGQLWLAY